MTRDPVQLIRGALSMKAANIERAGKSYLHDQVDRGKSIVTSYVVGICFLAAAGIFVLVSCFIGAAALFRYVEIHYGLFEAFGAAAAATLLLAAIAAMIGFAQLNSKEKKIVPLASRLRVAAHSNPINAQNVKDAATAVMLSKGRPSGLTLGLALAGTVLLFLNSRRR